MKKLLLPIMTAILFFSLFPSPLSSALGTTPGSIAINSTGESTPAEVLLDRLDEINAMDKSELSRPQKKVLRQEIREIKHELKAQSQGVYLSVGAIIIIVLLLILLL